MREPTDLRHTDTTELDSLGGDPRASARLLVEEPGHSPRVVMLPEGAEVRVGRARSVELSLDDTRASRIHATLRFDGQAVFIQDAGSSNGTWVDDAAVKGVQRIASGALVRIGGTKIAVVVSSRALAGEAEVPTASGRDVVAVDPATTKLFSLVRRLAASDLPVLIVGETGSGKEVVARALHGHSARAARPFVALNCATLPEALAESELFGHEKGAFTGADARKLGVFEHANGGTLLLDEVGELSPTSQARLLRALPERVIQRVGAPRPMPVDVRVVAATNRDLVAAVARGTFREDLYFRLNGVTVSVPPLRSRPLDLDAIVDRVLAEHGGPWTLGPGVRALLHSYRWPGNVRELRNAIESALALSDGHELRVEHLPPAVRGLDAAVPTGETGAISKLDEIERRSVINALEATGWNQSQAARVLGISRRGLIYKLERYGLKPPPRPRS